MKRALLIFGFILLAGCTTVKPVSPSLVYQSRAAYDAAVLAPAARYAQLPRCAVAAPPCSDPAVIHKLRMADDAANTAFVAATNFVIQNPTADATYYINAANVAIQAALQIAQQYGVK